MELTSEKINTTYIILKIHKAIVYQYLKKKRKENTRKKYTKSFSNKCFQFCSELNWKAFLK